MYDFPITLSRGKWSHTCTIQTKPVVMSIMQGRFKHPYLNTTHPAKVSGGK